MIPKKLDQISEEDLDTLIENEVFEIKTLEYKELVYLDDRGQKKEFLADVSSFANASGGDLIIGLKEEDGIPIEKIGLDNSIIDELKGKIEGLIRDCTEPRIHIDIHSVPIEDSKSILIIRTLKSWRSPHRVLLRDNRFYSRNSNGKYQLDIDEIRNAFNLTDNFTDRIKSFRETRLSKIIANETPISLNDDGITTIHIIPITAFNLGQNYEINAVDYNDLKLINGMPAEERYNIDGILSYYENPSPFGYVQLFKNGIIEAVDSSTTNSNNKSIPSGVYEPKLIKAITNYINILNKLNVETPIFIFISLINVKGYLMGVNTVGYHIGISRHRYVIDRNILLPPESILENYDETIEQVMKNCFDSIWNACGYPSSKNYDENGNWNPQR